MLNIQPATLADLPIIRQIAHETWPHTFAGIISPEQIDYMLEMMYSPPALQKQIEEGCQFILCYQPAPETSGTGPGTPVGFASYQLDYLPDTAKIHKLYFLPSAQGQGYGRQTIEAIERHVRAVGQNTLRLDVNYKNQALGMYEHLGFEKTDRYNTDIGNGYLMEDWRMEKSLV